MYIVLFIITLFFYFISCSHKIWEKHVKITNLNTSCIMHALVNKKNAIQ